MVQTYLLGDRISVKIVVEVRRRSTSMIKLRALLSLKKLKLGGILKSGRRGRTANALGPLILGARVRISLPPPFIFRGLEL